MKGNKLLLVVSCPVTHSCFLSPDPQQNGRKKLVDQDDRKLLANYCQGQNSLDFGEFNLIAKHSLTTDLGLAKQNQRKIANIKRLRENTLPPPSTSLFSLVLLTLFFPPSSSSVVFSTLS